ncbi:hypothetical protein DH2020_046776 [Rehmannia glutinosa]|uniref:3-ketoacyl-CoA synthase n=1 Tax=Rehmannia glutinosa TaxID=99300 RepID=A0ABR0UAG8_REHGL
MSETKSSTPLIPPSTSQKLPDFKKSIKLKYVKLGYHYLITHGMYLFLSPLVVIIAAQLSTFSLQDLYVLWDHLRFNLISVIVCSALLVFLSTVYFITRPRPVYLVNFSCYKPDDARKCTRQIFMERSKLTGSFTDENLEFQRKILERSGLGESTYLPDAVLRVPPNPCMAEARKEAETVMFGAIDELLAKTSLKPKDIGILIVNCSLFNPTPSLSAMVINHYKLRDRCSSRTVSFVWGAAILLSNKRSDYWRSKYRLVHTVRTHKGSDDKCFSCVTQMEDPNGKVGVALSKDLMAVAGDALKTNITTLGPLVLPMSEQLLFSPHWLEKAVEDETEALHPGFQIGVQHFCIHAGGRAVLDELEKNLQLSDWHMEPSRMTLYRFGNTFEQLLCTNWLIQKPKGGLRKETGLGR